MTIRAGQYLVDALFSLGPTRPQAMGGHRPADWPEITAFAQGTRTVTEPWELEALHRMAQAYTGALDEGANPLCIPPLERETP